MALVKHFQQDGTTSLHNLGINDTNLNMYDILEKNILEKTTRKISREHFQILC